MSSEITLSKNTNRSHKLLYPYLFCILFYIFLYLFSLEIFREMCWKCAHFKLVFNSEFSLCILNGNWNGSIGYDSDGNPDFLVNDWQFGHLRSQHQTRPNQLIALKRNCLKTRIFDNLDKSDKYMEKNLIDIFLITLERSNNKSIHKDNLKRYFWKKILVGWQGGNTQQKVPRLMPPRGPGKYSLLELLHNKWKTSRPPSLLPLWCICQICQHLAFLCEINSHVFLVCLFVTELQRSVKLEDSHNFSEPLWNSGNIRRLLPFLLFQSWIRK